MMHQITRSIPSEASAVDAVHGLTDGVGCDCVIEAVGVPETFELCQELVAPGGIIANVGVHGKSCRLAIEKLWGMNICKFSPLTHWYTARLTGM